jgi:signal transduction histidine kinase
MNTVKAGIREWMFYVIYYILAGSVISRMVPYFIGTNYLWIIVALLGGYVLLLSTERIVSSRIKWYLPVYIVLQLGIILTLLIIPKGRAPGDYYLNLIFPLCGQVMWNMSGRFAKYWIIAFCSFCVITMMLSYSFLEALGFSFTYIAGCLLVSVLSSATLRSNEAQMKSQALLSELQVANKKLQDYAFQVEELAAAEERNRLARELHDSVSQTIFSMTLTAQAARMLMESDPPRAVSLLDHLQTLSHNALAEMRTLIQELRPHSVVQNGLVAALHKQVKDRLAQDGLKVVLQIHGDRRLPTAVEEGLFRVVQEALNNVVKHSRTDSASIQLDLESDTPLLVIEDHGVGFEPARVNKEDGHVGLQSMEERVRSFGGKLTVDSRSGAGTRIQVEGIPTELAAGNGQQE